MANRQFWNNLKGLSCSLLLLFGTFFLLVLSVVVGLYAAHLSSLWPYLLVLSICLIGLLSWIQLTAVRAEHRLAVEGVTSNMINTIPTIAGLISARGSPVSYPPPPPYCEASLYKLFKPEPAWECSQEIGTLPPPSYDEAIKNSEVTVPGGSDMQNKSEATENRPDSSKTPFSGTLHIV